MHINFFLALLVACSTVSGMVVADTDGDPRVPRIAKASNAKGIRSKHKIQRLRRPQKLKNEERFDAAAYMLDSDDESTTSKKRKDEKISHKASEKPLSPKAKMWSLASRDSHELR
ncbi:hypothetical protein PInf_015197 [Phytophthora infestans]|nr:hypothetical protein PInf_015197 [Phytophthora infestans]